MTAVPQPSFGPNGFIIPNEQQILAGVQTDLNAAFGGNLNPGLSTPQGQLATTLTAIIGDAYAMFAWFTNQVDPAYASGRMQDAIARIYFIYRIPAQPTIVTVRCIGLQGVTIPIGARVSDSSGNIYDCQSQGVIAGSGFVDLPFANEVTGPIPCAQGTVGPAPYTSIPGWDTATNAADGVVGSVVESRAAFELRRARSTGINSVGPISAIQAAVLQVPGVTDAYSVENDRGVPIGIQGVIVGANSIYVAVVGGSNQEVAEAIWSRKAPGCGYTGNTSVTVVDSSPNYSPPLPTYVVTFERPASLDIVVVVTIVSGPSTPDNALAQVQEAVIDAFSGADGGLPARIGSTIYASRYYAGIASLGPWALIVNILVGAASDGAGFNGEIDGVTLSVSDVDRGVIQIGQLVQGANVTPGTIILAGRGLSWTVSISQSAASGPMTSVNLDSSRNSNIDEIPVIDNADVVLILQ